MSPHLPLFGYLWLTARMSSRLRSILGGSNRVKKKPSGPKRSSSAGSNNRASPASSSWSDSLPRTKAGTSSTTPAKPKPQGNEDEESGGLRGEYAPDAPLPDSGLVHALATDLALRDVPQAMRYAQDRMFTPLPEQPSSYGLSSTRVADVLNFCRNMPKLTTTNHLHALLRSPTAVERETAELVRAGAVRKLVILRRGAGNRAGGGVVEFLLEAGELEGMVTASGALLEGTREAFLAWLKQNPAKLQVSASNVDRGGGDGTLTPEQVDQLVRGGFLTTYHNFDIGHVSSGFARPEDRGTMLSMAAVSRAAAGSFAAVGGSDAIHSAGGSGGARSGGAQSRPDERGGDLSLAVPGQGAYLKLMTAALSHLTSTLAKSTFKEMPEGLLRERWEGGVANDSKQHAGKRGRREFAGVLPGRTRKWKEFYGLSFDWILHEAVGAGLVEVFETGSVGRGVRLL